MNMQTCEILAMKLALAEEWVDHFMMQCFNVQEVVYYYTKVRLHRLVNSALMYLHRNIGSYQTLES